MSLHPSIYIYLPFLPALSIHPSTSIYLSFLLSRSRRNGRLSIHIHRRGEARLTAPPSFFTHPCCCRRHAPIAPSRGSGPASAPPAAVGATAAAAAAFPLAPPPIPIPTPIPTPSPAVRPPPMPLPSPHHHHHHRPPLPWWGQTRPRRRGARWPRRHSPGTRRPRRGPVVVVVVYVRSVVVAKRCKQVVAVRQEAGERARSEDNAVVVSLSFLPPSFNASDLWGRQRARHRPRRALERPAGGRHLGDEWRRESDMHASVHNMATHFFSSSSPPHNYPHGSRRRRRGGRRRRRDG